jgi:hypothetical protein
VLAYSTSLGVATVLLTTLPSPKYRPGLLPDPSTHALAAGCTAAVPWQQSVPTQAAMLSQSMRGGEQQQPGAGSGSINRTDSSAAMRRRPMSSMERLWHSLDAYGVSGRGFLEPWIYISPQK